jgi:hypothetical protein
MAPIRFSFLFLILATCLAWAAENRHFRNEGAAAS